MNRDSFVFYRSFYEAFNEDVPPEVFSNVMKALCEYALNGKEPELNGISLMAWKLIKPQVDANNKRYEDGKKGGRPKKKTTGSEKENQWLQKTEPNVNVNVNVNENDNVNVNEPETGETHDILTLGTLENVFLTPEEHEKLKATYTNTNKLIDKVSAWLPNAKTEQHDHYALCIKFAQNDDWPKKPKPESPKPEVPRDKLSPEEQREAVRIMRETLNSSL